MYADVRNTCLRYTPARAWYSQHLFEMYTTLPAKNAHALVYVRICNGAEASWPWKLLQTYVESCASIVQAVVCHPPFCLPDEISSPTMFAQEIRPNPRYLMTRSLLWCCTSIIRSSTLVQASSSLSIGRTCAWPRRLPDDDDCFYYL